MSDSNRPIVITLIAVICAIAALAVYFYSASSDEPEVTEQIALPPEVQAPEPVLEPEVLAPEALSPEPQALPTPEPEPPIFVLPLLDESDQLIRDGAVSLTRHEGINPWLGPNELIRKFVAFADNVAHGQVAKAPVRALAPEGAFLVRPLPLSSPGIERFELDKVSFDRYDRITEIVISVDQRRAAEFYHLLKPLVQEAYGELGYGDKPFDEVFFQSIGQILEAPIIEDQIVLVRPSVMYRFEDENLENLSALQKQMIRMGPRNTRLIQAKVREIELELREMLDQ
ncbi:MAG: hypothetical protein ACI8Z1_002209 [Candidatus Azotimanducaceae bacterium]|jgi:hypothetical protein